MQRVVHDLKIRTLPPERLIQYVSWRHRFGDIVDKAVDSRVEPLVGSSSRGDNFNLLYASPQRVIPTHAC